MGNEKQADQETCGVCGREKWAYAGPARKRENCMAAFKWTPDKISQANAVEHWRLGYERQRAENVRLRDSFQAVTEAIGHIAGALLAAERNPGKNYHALRNSVPAARRITEELLGAARNALGPSATPEVSRG